MGDALYSRTKNHIERTVIKPLYRNKEEHYGAGGLRAVHITYYKAKNAGDTVLSQCVRKTLSYLCKINHFDIVSPDEPVSDALIKRINKADVLVVGGGGLFLPDTNKNSISGWQWAIPAQDIKKINVPIIIYSVGYNYFRGQEINTLFEQSLKLLAGRCAFLGLRNTGSCREVEEIIGTEKDACTSPVFQPCTTTLIRKIYSQLAAKETSRCVAFNMAFDREALRYGENKETILLQTAAAAKSIEKRGYTIYCVGHCTEDLRFAEYLDKCGVGYEKVDMSHWFPQKVINFYNNMGCVLGMRGHAQMIPFGTNTKIISLGTHEKLRWFLEDINALDWYVELGNGRESIQEKIEETFVRVNEKNADLTDIRLLTAQEALWGITTENARTIKKLI